MSLDSTLIFGFLAVFSRVTAMLMSAPLYGQVVPVNIRIMVGGIVAMALLPVIHGHLPVPPTDLLGILMLMGREITVGLLIGGCLQFMLAAIQMAGTFLDLQIGIGSAQVFNPMLGQTATPIGQFKFLLGTVLVLMMNGHHLMFDAFVGSYSLPPLSIESMPGMLTTLTSLIGQLMLLALQIAAPVAAVTVIIDVATRIVNKAVPQTQPFLISLPAKLAVGFLALALGLPALVGAVTGGLDITFDHIRQLIGGA